MRKKKPWLYSLSIEITRQCNMKCAHCMRGEAEFKYLDFSKLRALLKQISGVSSLTLTGGEPSLYVDGINNVRKLFKQYHVDVNSFYIVTNGKDVSDTFLKAILDWHLFVIENNGESELNTLALSSDMFHEDIPHENIEKLRSFSFFDEKDKCVDWAHGPSKLTGIGKAANLVGIPTQPQLLPDEITYDIDDEGRFWIDENLAITVDGEILADCDYAYKNTDLLYLCDAENFADTMLAIHSDPSHVIFPRRP